MTTHHTCEFTRPSAHSAKNARQAGAPNTHQSGENLMVSTNNIISHAADRVTVEAVLFGGGSRA